MRHNRWSAIYLCILYRIYDFCRSILVSLVGHKLDSRTFCIWFISRYGIIGIIWGFGLDTGSSIWGFVGQIDLGSSVRLVWIRFKGRRSRTSPLLVWVRGWCGWKKGTSIFISEYHPVSHSNAKMTKSEDKLHWICFVDYKSIKYTLLKYKIALWELINSKNLF